MPRTEEQIQELVRELYTIAETAEWDLAPEEVRSKRGRRRISLPDGKILVLVAAAVILIVVGIVVANGSPSRRSTTNVPTTSAAPSSSGLVLHVSPTANLRNGEIVQVSVSGFPPGKVFLSECASDADVNALGCGAQLAAQPFVEIDNGAGTESFNVSDKAPSAPLSPDPTALCTNQCVLVATSGAPASGARHVQAIKLVFGS